MLDLLFPSHNRLEYTIASFDALVTNTNWDLVRRVYVVDDASTDGTDMFVDGAVFELEVESEMVSSRLGGPVAALNYVLDRSDCQILAKVDNDLIVPPGWLDTMLDVIDRNPELDALGLEPGFAPPIQPDYVRRGYKPARHIGGQGLFRTRAFQRRRPQQHERFFGMTEFMKRHMRCGWIDPDLAAFNLDHLPFEPWRSLADEYVEKGWSRAWAPYSPRLSEYWTWWTQAREELSA